ncbi:MAG: DUF874 family protein [Planctomycetota bacterium]
MSQDQLKIPTFKSLEEFNAWWKRPEVAEFRQNHPDKLEKLQEHHLVKPWLEILNKQEKPLSHSQTIGKVFGKYLLEKKLGQGGMGVVYLASDAILKRQVALKIMLLKSEEMIERFTREAQAMAKLKHPNIIQVYEVGTADKCHYFTMDYIKGASLEDFINDKKHRSTHRRVAEIIRDIASALDYAHRQGIIHRDIKPSNILIDLNNHPYLMDFGLAKEVTGLDRSLTLSGSIMGTPDYMSPEQARGNKKMINHRSDIFSLGATLYHSLSGHPPFRGDELYQVLDQVVNKDPIPPSRFIRGLPKDLETICLKCMDKEQERRYQTGRELANDISRYLAGESISAKPISVVTRIFKRGKKNKTAMFSILVTAVILIAVVISLMISSASKNRQIEEYRQKAYESFKENKFEEVLAMCNKILAFLPHDEEIKGLLRKSESAIKEKEERIQTEKEKAKFEEDKMRLEKDRAKVEEEKMRLEKEKIEAEREKMRVEKERAKAEEEKMRVEKELTKAESDKMQKAKEIREKAKAILDRVSAGIHSPDDRIKAANDALKIDPSYGDAYQVMGYSYKDKKDYIKAYEYFTKAIENTPTLAYSYYERAIITAYFYQNYPASIPDFNKVIELDPKGYIGYASKGIIDFYLGNYDDAIVDCNKAIELKSNDGDSYNVRGYAYYQKGELKSAIADFSEAIKLIPDSERAYTNRGAAYYVLGQFDKALADYNEAIKINPNYTLPYNNRGNLYRKQGKYDLAMAEYNKAIKINPDDVASHNNRGLTYEKKGDMDSAFADYNKAIEIDPKCAEAHNSRGNIYKKKGELDLAIKDYTKAIDLKPNLAEVYINRSYTYKDKGDISKAITDGEMFLKLAPNHSAAKQMRDLIEQWKKELNNK